MDNKVSVIIPVYQAVNFVEAAVLSAIHFAVVGEVILVDDGGRDGSFEKCKELEIIYEKVTLISHLERSNFGVAASRNLGIKHARFPYIAFLDSDDKFFENRFDYSLQVLNIDSSIDACYGFVKVKYIDQHKEKAMGPPIFISSKKLFSYLLNGGYFHTNSVTIRKSYIELIGGFNEKLFVHEDVELWLRMAYYGNVVGLKSEHPIAEYFIHGQGLSKKSNWKSKWLLWTTVFKTYFFHSITWKDRLLIIKQLIKAVRSRLMSFS